MALGSACSAIGQPPNSAIVSAGLETRGDRAEATGGFTDVWRGRVNVGQVAIKVFRVYPLQHLEEAKEVSTQPASEVGSRTKFSDSVETGAGVEEAIP